MTMNDQYKLTEMEADVIGEVMNISMGAAATAMSTILDKKVNITTPRIETIGIEEFEFSYLEPVIGVLIKYVEGFDGTNMLLLREEDMKKILSHLLSMDPEEIVELDEISISAICEIMNQMMGSAASALASFLGQVVNISPPEVMDTTKPESVRQLFSLKGDSLVSIKFNLSIDGLVESEFISAMDPQLAKEMVKLSMGANDVDTSESIGSAEVSPQAAAASAQPEIPPAQTAPVQQMPDYAAMQTPPVQQMPDYAAMQTPPVQQMPDYAAMQPPGYVQGYPQGYPPMQPQPQGYPYQQMGAVPSYVEKPVQQAVHTTPYSFKPLGGEKASDMNLSENNLDLIMSVPIQITVELGRTRKKIKDIAELTLGNIVELDRQAGDQVDVVANGRLIARGDVVVVDDNYSVRITEIVKPKDNSEL
jgi:flagellar motor switch protein FliN/FliY